MRKTRSPPKFPNKVDVIDDETFKTLVKDNTKWSNLSMACGYDQAGGRNFLASRIEKHGLNTNHFDDDVIPSDKIFVVDSRYTCNGEIKKRLLRDFDRSYECVACNNEHFTKCDGVLMWNNKEIVLQLEHKNGNNTDNRLENLEFLCPSCHSQTSTFGGGNSKKYKAGQAWLEEGKTSHAPGSIASLLN
jgi:Zn finger protein HypA/HybF involved in hydrogenase expression